MRVISLRTDWMLDEGTSYHGEFIDEPEGDTWDPQGKRVRIHYRDADGVARTCVRTFGDDVIDKWSPKAISGPYDFSA